MSYLNDLRTGELWVRMKSYINNKLSVVDDKILHAGYSRQTLLWTNPNPTSNFAAQTVALDLSDYDFVEIYVRHSTSYKYITFKIMVGSTGILTATNDNSSLTNLGYFRNATVRASGVEFGSGYFNNASNDSALVPYKIYGIKNGIPVSEADDALLSLKGVSKMIKLWENASPTSEFVTQQINLDLSGYEYFIFGFKLDTSKGEVYYQIVSKFNGSDTQLWGIKDMRSSYEPLFLTRAVSAHDSYVWFGDSNYKPFSQSTASFKRNTDLTPVVILGIKEVQ